MHHEAVCGVATVGSGEGLLMHMQMPDPITPSSMPPMPGEPLPGDDLPPLPVGEPPSDLPPEPAPMQMHRAQAGWS